MPTRCMVLLISVILFLSGGALSAAQSVPEIQTEMAVVGDVAWPADPCQTTGDAIALSGRLHLVIQMNPLAAPSTLVPLQILFRLRDGAGVGTTGTPYRGSGAALLRAAWAPVDPWLVFFSALFDLTPATACCRGTVIVSGVLRFQSDGSLNLDPCEEGTACTYVAIESLED